ncbi:response regulator [Thermodesulforhabdus norvegica]|uniref:Putative two-component system response regulator n=1 Tax=Thermodesulforhabdus norvegica TaxID=39841 RepID=A0A1I4RBP9_9BACT|nr:two-component system response regulator [Thermodesulforhabdus norvegica]SFM49718.1 putative two-component system response regulator [Thermodesulforhabdus norvegica]
MDLKASGGIIGGVEGRPAGEIVVVDDMKESLEMITTLLSRRGYSVRGFTDGVSALAYCKENPPDLVLLDINMPGMNGYEVCRSIKQIPTLRDVPIIFVSGLHEEGNIVAGFESGSVDYVEKPFRTNELLARVETHLKIHRMKRELEAYSHHLEFLVRQKVEELTQAYKATIFAMAKLAEYRDDATGHHLERVREYSRLLAEQLARMGHYSEVVTPRFIENIFEASPLHDIGKVAIPDSILLKPGRLTDEEMEIMKQHTVIGASALRDVLRMHPKNEFIAMGIEIAMSHHERWDGMGYPAGLAGDSIPLAARIVAVSDVYDALRSRRPYKAPLPHSNAVGIILAEKGTHFDPLVIDAFVEIQNEFERIAERLSD